MNVGFLVAAYIYVGLYLKSQWGVKANQLLHFVKNFRVEFYEGVSWKICISCPFPPKVKREGWGFQRFSFLFPLGLMLHPWNNGNTKPSYTVSASKQGGAGSTQSLVQWVFVSHCCCNFYCISWCAHLCLVSIPRAKETLLNIPVPKWHYLIESLSVLPPLGCCNHLKSLDFGVLTRV